MYETDHNCEQCGQPVRVHSLRTRHIARFCSAACRQRAYRRRVEGLPETLPVRERFAGMIREPFSQEHWKRKR